LIGKILHQWDGWVNYQTLTFEEIIRSIQRADVANYLEEDNSLIKDYIETVMTQEVGNS